MNHAPLSVPVGWHGAVDVLPGPRLLAGASLWPTLAEHRHRWPAPRRLRPDGLLEQLSQGAVRGRGGAGFPFARKVETALRSGRRRVLVVNASEGEPGSAKDSVLLTTAPHLVLDGAEAVARALGVTTVHVVVPGERRAVASAAENAVRERRGGPRFRLHRTTGGFVGGQARAVLELIDGRPNLPVTAWAPEAVDGLRGRPTLLSNAETFAQVATLLALGAASFARLGTREEPGTTLLTVAGDSAAATVLEVAHGARLSDALDAAGYATGPVLMGGYHGAWLPAAAVAAVPVLAAALRDAGAALGAGVVLPLAPGECPVERTAGIVAYLASQSAGRCGPCRFGLPALSRATGLLAQRGFATAADRMAEVADVVTGRGACAHPDGTARLVRSLLGAFPEEVAAHAHGRCDVRERAGAQAVWR